MKLTDYSFQRLLSCGVFLLIITITSLVYCQNIPIIKSGDHFPELPLSLTPDSNLWDYLGIERQNPFYVKDIAADLVLVEIMNINCGSCQKQAPVYNDLFDKIQSSGYKDKIKIMAIGAGNQNEFIKKYQDHFQSPYPIVEDPGLDLYTAIGKSPVPLALYVRIDKNAGTARVAATHTGYQNDYEAIFNKMISLLEMDDPRLQQNYGPQENKFVNVRAVINEAELIETIKTAFKNENENYTTVEKIVLKDNRVVFVGQPAKTNPHARIFARMISQPPPCDLCHDAHFIYIFDNKGKILQFVPVRLSKYGNKKWTEEDIHKMKHRLEGRFIFQPFQYDAKVDAITSATITSLVVIQSLNEGESIFSELKTLGLME